MAPVSRIRAEWLARHILVHEAGLRAWLRSRVPGDLSVDDVVQESYAILAALETVEHIRSPRTYMFEVAKSVIRQHLRRAPIVTFEAVADLEALQIPDAAPGTEQLVSGRQELARLASLIEALPPRCREAFVLRKVRGLCQRATATTMGVSENTVEKHVGKAMTILLAAMGSGGTAHRMASTGDDAQRTAPSPRERRAD